MRRKSFLDANKEHIACFTYGTIYHPPSIFQILVIKHLGSDPNSIIPDPKHDKKQWKNKAFFM